MQSLSHGGRVCAIRSQESYVWKLIWMSWSPRDDLVHFSDSGQVESALRQPSNFKGWPVKLTEVMKLPGGHLDSIIF